MSDHRGDRPTSKYNPNCLRKVANWSAIRPPHKFDKPAFDPETVLKDMPTAAPKLESLLDNIRKLDEEDMKTHGKLFKHFIFSEVKMGGYGSKIITSAMIARGMKLVYEPVRGYKVFEHRRVETTSLRMIPDSKLIETRGNNVALLASTSVFDATITVPLKKSILSKYNERPTNVNGDLIRFIVMDAGYKEGIDLFDVKYVHIYEPQFSKADQKQVIGRSTRTCGQKGLEFHPTRGWPLHVFVYDLTTTEEMKEKLGDSETLFKAYMNYNGIDLRKMTFADELERAVIVGSVDYELTKNIHRFKIDEDDFDLGNFFQGGAYGTELKCTATAKCSSSRPTKDVPINNPLLVTAYLILGKDIPASLKKSKTPRAFFCQELKSNPQYCALVNELYKDPNGFMRKYRTQLNTAIHTKRHSNLPVSMRQSFVRFLKQYVETGIVIVDKGSYGKDEDEDDGNGEPDDGNGEPDDGNGEPDDGNGEDEDDGNGEPDDEIEVEEKKEQRQQSQHRRPPHPERRLNFLETRKYIQEHFSQYKWPTIRMENGCIPKGQQGGASEVLSLSPSQDFIRNYFTPQLPQKGMLLFHGVGVGKTCTAIATATSTFEKEGYTILWVTRTTLKSDIWKNMFDQVCSDSISNMIRSGASIPSGQSDRMRLLSKSWSIRPMSYKQFTNLVSGQNDLYQTMVKKNGSSDPLRKTLLIIDEAHKLYGGSDLSTQEQPDMKKLHSALMKSYRVSGKDSVRVLLMTATPYTNDPMEMIKLLNLLRDDTEQLADDYEPFSKKYLDDEGQFTKKGRFQFLNDIAGYVSYLNRERDARQFAQPMLHVMNSEMSSKSEKKAREIRSEYKEKIDPIKAELKLEKSKYTEQMKKYKEEHKKLMDECKGTRGNARKECIEKLKERIEKNERDTEAITNAYKEKMEKLVGDEERLENERDEELKKVKITNFQNIIIEKKCKEVESNFNFGNRRGQSQSQSQSQQQQPPSPSQSQSQQQRQQRQGSAERREREFREQQRERERQQQQQQQQRRAPSPPPRERTPPMPKTPSIPKGDTDAKERLANYVYHELKKTERQTGRRPKYADVVRVASKFLPLLNEKRYKLLFHPDKCDDCSDEARQKMTYIFQCLIG